MADELYAGIDVAVVKPGIAAWILSPRTEDSAAAIVGLPGDLTEQIRFERRNRPGHGDAARGSELARSNLGRSSEICTVFDTRCHLAVPCCQGPDPSECSKATAGIPDGRLRTRKPSRPQGRRHQHEEGLRFAPVMSAKCSRCGQGSSGRHLSLVIMLASGEEASRGAAGRHPKKSVNIRISPHSLRPRRARIA